jgi:hypothetical protein
MQIAIHTQFRENYAAHSWDGTGECGSYWKNKGGSTYLVTGVDASASLDAVVGAVDRHQQITHANNYSEEYIIDTEYVEDSYIPHEEELQLEFDGKITYPSPRVKFTDLVI